MKLSRGTIRPGIVLEVLKNGDIKATAPGLFNVNESPENLPPIMPWFIGGNSNTFSSVKKYDEVWVMNFSDNPQQLYWFRKDDPEKTNIPITENNVEILCNREVGGEWCSIYFSDGSGWVISKGGSIIKIRPNGSILLSTDMPNRCIDINSSSISLGSEGKSAHPAAYGDVTTDILNDICSLLSKIGSSTFFGFFMSDAAAAITSKLPGITKKISKISSKNVTLD